MRTFIQPGDTLSLLAPHVLTAGAGALVGSLFVVAKAAAASGAAFEGATSGVFTLAKATGEAWTVGVRLYWDNTNKRLTTTVGSNTLVGCATAAAISGATTGNAYIDGAVR